MKTNHTQTITKKDAELLHKFEKAIEISFKSIELLKTALTHRSYLNEWRGGSIQHNERLEFLGDAVLEVLVSELLYKQYPTYSEGDLTSFRAATVRTESLADAGRRINLGKYIFMSKGEEASGGRNRKYLLANTYEALIGAIYLDRGMFTVKKFLKEQLFITIPEIVENRLDIDDKSKLQEISQEELKQTPTYEIVKESGPDHDKTFTMKVLINGKDMGQGKGKNKQEAEQDAAGYALKNWKDLTEKHFNNT